jgi:alkylation response protein AidB-like acyl-CoA dehydrogenase
MRFALSAEQVELKKVARKYLAAHWASAQVRAVVDAAAPSLSCEVAPGLSCGAAPGLSCGAPAPHGSSSSSSSSDAWRKVAEDLGWAAVLVPEAHGGMGLGWTEACLLAEETGRSLACIPFFSTVCLATGAILAAGDDAQQARYLPDVASGRVRAALAFAEGTDVNPATSRRPPSRRPADMRCRVRNGTSWTARRPT